ncbi:hypothetical protein BB561_002820 [Smittium simulii]|uniref:RRM domain-containing protein n=1 Tax=Smittium simulii TaxID=133385 RepID=A0A2T9YP09_9FUNG|nr:hypothetical protein BB561_002820 [Smittium simulii]
MSSEDTSLPSRTIGISTLFVRNIPLAAKNDQLEEFFSQIGPVRSCFIVTKKPQDTESENTTEESNDPQNTETESTQNTTTENNNSENQSRGFGFVQFAVPKDAQTALEELPSKLFLEKAKLKMEFAIKKGVSSDNVPGPPIRKVKLKHKFRKTGTINNIFLEKSNSESTDKTNEFSTAIIEYANIEDVKRSIKKLNHHIFKGVAITAELMPRKLDQSSRLVVRNLSFKLREKDLFDIFSKFGLVEQVILPRKFVGGPLRGFAFITMNNRDDAEKALNGINGTLQIDRTVAIDWAIPKDEYSANINKDEENDDKNGEIFTEKELSKDRETTFFVKNVSFETQEDDLYSLFSKFGKVKYCRIVLDRDSKRSKGTAFVCFWDKEIFDECYSSNLEAQKSMENISYSLDNQAKDSSENRLASNSVLVMETPKTLPIVAMFTIDGRFLQLNPAISREDAQVLTVKNNRMRKQLDKRNTYLLREGVVFPNTKAAERFSTEDLDTHQKYYGSRKNIPKSIKGPELRKAVMDSIKLFKEKVKSKEIEHLSKDELSEGWDRRPKLSQVKLLGTAPKIDKESKGSKESKNTKSSGMGFVEFKDHAHSLACLRVLNLSDPNKIFMNQNTAAASSKRMMFVEFAIENTLTLRKRSDKIENHKKRRESDVLEKEDKSSYTDTDRPAFKKSKFGHNDKIVARNSERSNNYSAHRADTREFEQRSQQNDKPAPREIKNKKSKSNTSKKPYIKKQGNQEQFNSTKLALKNILKTKTSN